MPYILVRFFQLGVELVPTPHAEPEPGRIDKNADEKTQTTSVNIVEGSNQKYRIQENTVKLRLTAYLRQAHEACGEAVGSASAVTSQSLVIMSGVGGGEGVQTRRGDGDGEARGTAGGGGLGRKK